MKILHAVQSYPPSTGGMQEVVSQLSERLARKGSDVWVATSIAPNRPSSINGVHIAEFSVTGSPLRGYRTDQEVKRYQQFLIDSDFDVITFFASQQWAFDTALPVLNYIKAKKVFVPTGFSALHLRAYRTYFRKMAEYMHQFDMNVFLSHDYRDINFARAHNVTKIMVIPNGASSEEFLAKPNGDIRGDLGIKPDQLMILHVGSHIRQKGHVEAIRIFRQASISNATLVIVGNKVHRGCYRSCKWQAALFNRAATNKKSGKLILIPSLDRTSTVDAYKTADVFLFPSQIECSPLVLFESIASKTPFLSTNVGNANEIVEWTGGGIILPTQVDRAGLSHADITKSAKILEELMLNTGKREKLAHSGFSSWKKSFTWDIITNKYQQFYKDLLT